MLHSDNSDTSLRQYVPILRCCLFLFLFWHIFFTMIVHLAGHGIPEKLCSNFGDIVRNKFHTALMIPITESKQISNPFPGDFPSFVEKLLEGFLSNDTKYTLCESDMFKHFWQLFPKNYMGYTKYVAQIDSLEQPVLNFESPMCYSEFEYSSIMKNLRENMRVNIWTRSQESSKFFLLPWLSQTWQCKNFQKRFFALQGLWPSEDMWKNSVIARYVWNESA